MTKNIINWVIGRNIATSPNYNWNDNSFACGTTNWGRWSFDALSIIFNSKIRKRDNICLQGCASVNHDADCNCGGTKYDIISY